MSEFHFECVECGASYPEERDRLVCEVCAGRQESDGATRGVLRVVLESLPGSWPSGESLGDRLTPFLPLGSPGELPPLPVGATPLLAPPRLRAQLRVPRLWVKDDSRNPSGSTKDRASWLVVAKAREYGYHTVAAASTGNAATAMAAVAAATGVEAVAFVPAAAPRAKLVQLLGYGATVLPIDGSYDDAFELCLEACREFGWYNRNTALNPFTTEGKKTAALEIAYQLDPEEPDVVFVPTGDGVIISGIAKGFADLERCGLLTRKPRLIAVQPEGSCAIAEALRNDRPAVEPRLRASSVADSLVVEAPRNAIQCLQEVRASGGAGITVSDDTILEAIPNLAAATGVFAEPAGAATLAGLEQALRQGLVDKDERIVLLVTGTGLKDIEAAGRAVELPPPLPATLEAVREVIRSG